MARKLTPAAPPFTKKTVPKTVRDWIEEIGLAHGFCERHGLRLYYSDAAYQIGVIGGDDIQLLLYPHTTQGTGNKSCRVRNDGSRDLRRAYELMVELAKEKPGYNTFSMLASDRNNARLSTFRHEKKQQMESPKP